MWVTFLTRQKDWTRPLVKALNRLRVLPAGLVQPCLKPGALIHRRDGHMGWLQKHHLLIELLFFFCLHILLLFTYNLQQSIYNCCCNNELSFALNL